MRKREFSLYCFCKTCPGHSVIGTGRFNCIISSCFYFTDLLIYLQIIYRCRIFFKMFFQLRLHFKSVFKSEFLCCHVSSMKWHPTIPPSASRESTIIAFFFRNGALCTAVTSGQFPYNATPANWKGPLKISKTYMCVCVCTHAYIYIYVFHRGNYKFECLPKANLTGSLPYQVQQQYQL